MRKNITRKRRILSLVAGLWAVLLIPEFTLASVALTPLSPQGLHSINKLRQNGEYVIYVLKDSQWQGAGSLSFDRFFRERQIDLSRYLSGPPLVKGGKGGFNSQYGKRESYSTGLCSLWHSSSS